MKRKILAMVILLAGAGLRAEMPAAIMGDYVEARSNHVYTCGCLYSGEQVTVGKEAILAWGIKEGGFRGLSLAGVKVVAVVVGEQSLSLAATPRKSVLYLDGITSVAQQQAVLDLFREQFREGLGEITGVESAPISFERENEGAVVGVGNTVRVEIRKARLPEDAHPGSRLWYQPFVPVAEPILGATLYYKYSGGSFARQWWESEPGITAYLGSFTLRAT
ncbi:MAG: DUF1326 domain-containing protein [Acidobacteria bacterium]|nr:DUF1326 domain-containing protein [Acidobacteriota bacterium]